MITCRECGAGFDENDEKCPYCGAANHLGKEKEYLEHLENMRLELERMEDDSDEICDASIKKNTLIIITAICLLIPLFILILITIYTDFILPKTIPETDNEDVQKTQILWHEEYIDDLDQMYENADYDGILAFFNEHAGDEGFSPYTWEHCDFMEVYDSYTQFKDEEASLDMTNLDALTWCLYDAASIDHSTTQDYFVYTDEELALIASWQEETAAFYHETLGLSDTEIEEMKSVIISDDELALPSSKGCREFLQQHFEF